MPERRYDNVRILQPDGTVIEGEDAIVAYFARERALVEEHGSTLHFQIYRADLRATTTAELQGPRLAELTWEGGVVGGAERVHEIADRVRAELGALVRPEERVTLFFARRPMREDGLFYADHFVLLPAWVQVVLHEGTLDALLGRVRQVSKPG